MGVAAAFRNHVSENGESNAADGSKDSQLGQQHHAHMVDGHGDQGDELQLVAGQSEFAVYFQGGLTWYHAKIGIMMSLQKLIDAGIIKL